MLGWILAGVAAATIGTALLGSSSTDVQGGSQSRNTQNANTAESDFSMRLMKLTHDATAHGTTDKEKLRSAFTEILNNLNRNPSSHSAISHLQYGIDMMKRYEVPVWVPYYHGLPMTLELYEKDAQGLIQYNSIGIITEKRFIDSSISQNVRLVEFSRIVNILRDDYDNLFDYVTFNSGQRGTYEIHIPKGNVIMMCNGTMVVNGGKW